MADLIDSGSLSSVKYELNDNILIQTDAEKNTKYPSSEKMVVKIFSFALFGFFATLFVPFLGFLSEDLNLAFKDKIFSFFIPLLGWLIAFCMLKFYRASRVKVPFNYVLFLTFTVSLSVLMAHVIESTDVLETFFLSILFTFITMIILIVYATKTNRDLTFLKTKRVCCMDLKSFLSIIFIVGFINNVVDFGVSGLNLVIGISFTIYSILFLAISIIIDVQSIIMIDPKYSLNQDELIYVSLKIYSKGIFLKVIFTDFVYYFVASVHLIAFQLSSDEPHQPHG